MSSAQRPGREDRALWTLPFVLHSLGNVAIHAVFFMLLATMASYTTQEFGASAVGAGLATSIFFLGAFVARFLAGRAVERLGPRRALIGGLVVFLVLTVVHLVALHLVVLVVVRFVHGIAYGVAFAALTAAVMRVIPASRRGEGTGWFSAGMAVATGLGPLVGLRLLQSYGMQTVFLSAVAFAAIALLVALGAARSVPGADPDRVATPLRLSSLVAPQVLPIATAVALTSVAFACVTTFVAPLAVERGLQQPVQWFFFVYAAVLLVLRPTAGIAQDRLGDAVVFVPACLSAAAGTALIGLADSGLQLLAGAALLGGGYGCLVSAGQVIAIRHLGVARAGTAVSTFFLALDLGGGLAPIVLGWVAQASDFRLTFLIAAGVAAIALPMSFLDSKHLPERS